MKGKNKTENNGKSSQMFAYLPTIILNVNSQHICFAIFVSQFVEKPLKKHFSKAGLGHFFALFPPSRRLHAVKLINGKITLFCKNPD